MKELNIRKIIFLLTGCFILLNWLPGWKVSAEESTVSGLVWQEEKYLLYVDGTLVSQEGWKKISNEIFYVTSDGTVTKRMKKEDGIWYGYSQKSNTSIWERQKKCWLEVLDKEYYFGKTGACTLLYNKKTKQLYEKKDGRMKKVKNKVYTLKDGKKYYFNSKGKKRTKAGWTKVNGKKYIRVGKKGYVTERMEKTDGRWCVYHYDYKKNKWIKAKDVWKTVDGKRYYFNKKGKCQCAYNTKTKKFYDYRDGTMKLACNAVRAIHGKDYYFGADGVKVATAGLYVTATNSLIYANAKGVVTKTIPGQVMECSVWNGKITACRVRDGNEMCYYDAIGNLRRRIDLNGKMIALTYDDGPSIYTSEILEVLEQHGCVATFFVVGNRVDLYADDVRRTFDSGCEIGNHSYTHATLTAISPAAIQQQIYLTNAAVSNITGVSPVILRPPGGAYSSKVKSAVGMPLVTWSVDSQDWKSRNSSSIQSAVLNKVKDGDIVLMHDLYQSTAQATRVIVPELLARGYQLVTVSEMADCRGEMANGMVYNSFR